MDTLDSCLCCDPGAPATPVRVSNRPGLSAIAYRVGTFAAFRETMLEALARELPELTTRAGDDHAITLLELWAALGDVLCFYQERIANEAFLRTAVRRDSVRRLAQLLDYRPRPGLSAEADIAFILDDDARAALAPGLRLMSLPGANEQPQTFETLESCNGIGELNRLRARPVPVADTPLAIGRSSMLITAGPEILAAGGGLVFFTATRIEERTITAVRAEDSVRRVEWAPPLTQDFSGGQVFRVVRPLRFFGWNAPDNYNEYDPGLFNAATNRWDKPPMWRSAATAGKLGLPDTGRWPLEARINGLVPGTLLLVAHDGAVELGAITAVAEAPTTLGTLSDTVSVLTLAGLSAITDRRRARVFALVPAPLVPRAYRYPDHIAGGRITLVPPPAAPIDPKRPHSAG